jgi:hypothetical protein
MKTRPSLTIVALAAITLLSACPGPSAPDEETDGGAAASPADAAAGRGAGGAGGNSAGAPGAGTSGHGGALRTPDAAAQAPSDGGAASANQTCTTGPQCASGFCVDGVCCDTACNGSCVSCALTGKVGTCSPVKNATDDTCGGDSICDPSATCRKNLGKSCSASNECASGNCVDGVCCTSSACGTCQACGVPGFEGSCTAVPRFTDDADSGCSGASTCNGLGECHLENGSACSAGSDCVSLSCTDGVCCNEACDGTCYSCDQAGSVGTCKSIDGAQDPSAVVACTGNDICTTPAGGAPSCKIKDGEPCTNSADCLHASCLTIYRDADGDGYGGTVSRICTTSVPAGYVATGGDCCDSDAQAHPGQSNYYTVEDACGSFDWNCNGTIDRSSTVSSAACGCLNLGKLGLSCVFCR